MRFAILGPVQVWAQERQLKLGGPQQVALLAFLLLHANRAVSSDALIDALWDGTVSGADKRVQMAIARFRKTLDAGAERAGQRVRTVSGGYLLAVDPGELDADEFRAGVQAGRAALDAGDPASASRLLGDALALWRGPALAEVAFADFAQHDIRQLDELRLGALESRIEADLQQGKHAEVISELEGLLVEQPTREPLAGQLMLALYRCGRQADALEAYQRTRTQLAEQLGLEPGPALKTLQSQILEQAPTLNLDDRVVLGGKSDRLPGADYERRAELPTGTVTFMFTDIEGSTRLLREMGAERYGAELERHRERVRRAIAGHGGSEFGTEGDALFIAFARASDALAAASEVQAALADGPIRVRIGVHSGEPLIVSGNYVGLDVHKAARICAAAHGGQVLVSQATRDLVGDGLRALGEYRLKDLTAPERLFQLGGSDFPPVRTLRATNLPVQPGPLLGRREELAELVSLAAASRLVTLTGPGGSGKTRLALALAAELSEGYEDGVWWIPLAAITDPALVLPSIAQTLSTLGDLRDHLAGKRVLLLLDNLEQVLDCAPLIAELLGGLPQLSVIATSRERLAVSFEQEYAVPPLDEITARELFVARARQLEPDFEPDETVGEICERLDRLPLALELASTRVKLMSTTQMLTRLEHRLDLLGKGRRGGPDRQATMRATIGWSYDLLSEIEQAVFRGLGVFAGSFELEAAEAVCGAALDDLQSLIDKSLLRRDASRRFFLLELTREYALEQLDAAGEETMLHRRHADWYLRLARRAGEHLISAEERDWLARLEPETDNFRAVLAWGSEHDPAGTIELATTLFHPWLRHGRHPELIPWLEGALATHAILDAHTRAVGLRTLGETLNFSDQYGKARNPLEQSLALFRELEDKAGEASVLMLLGMLFGNQGPVPRGIELHEAAIAIARATGDKLTMVRGLNMLAGCLVFIGELERSAATYEQARAICTELGWPSMAESILGGLAGVALAQSDADSAERYQRDALELSSGFGDERNEIYALAGLACAAALRGDHCAAGRLWAVVETAENRLGMRMLAAERAGYERIVNPVKDDQAFQAGYQAGRELDLAEAVRELRTSPRTPARTAS